MDKCIRSGFSIGGTLKALSIFLTLALAQSFLAKKVFASDQQVGANFAQADSNEDGALSQGEFKTFLNLNAAQGIGRAQMVRDRNLYDRAFGKLDSNRDGVLSETELQSGR